MSSISGGDNNIGLINQDNANNINANTNVIIDPQVIIQTLFAFAFSILLFPNSLPIKTAQLAAIPGKITFENWIIIDTVVNTSWLFSSQISKHITKNNVPKQYSVSFRIACHEF